ncbi:hypothetical protein ACIRU3_15930 [Streptomyces sp. NPDC101151]|uniref:hypothetical protein n=1 Tax=Streptomyces sp. NPDC101151 TaxID=3366115 RepID=UPI00381E58A9
MAGDGVPAAQQALDAPGDPLQLGLQRGDRLRSGAGDVNGPGPAEAGQKLLDDPRRRSGVEQPPDLQDPVLYTHIAAFLGTYGMGGDRNSVLLVFGIASVVSILVREKQLSRSRPVPRLQSKQKGGDRVNE